MAGSSGAIVEWRRYVSDDSQCHSTCFAAKGRLAVCCGRGACQSRCGDLKRRLGCAKGRTMRLTRWTITKRTSAEGDLGYIRVAGPVWRPTPKIVSAGAVGMTEFGGICQDQRDTRFQHRDDQASRPRSDLSSKMNTRMGTRFGGDTDREERVGESILLFPRLLHGVARAVALQFQELL